MAIEPKANVGTVGQGISRARLDSQSGVMRTAEDFGAQFGQDLERFGATGARVSATHLDNLNRAAVMDANNQFSTKAREITQAAKLKQGKNAAGSLEQAKKDMQAAYDETSKELKSPVQQRAFTDAARRTNMQIMQQVEYHQVKEAMVYQKETEKAKLFNYVADAEASIGTGQYLNELMRGYNGTQELITEAGKREGKSKDVIDAEIRVAKDNFHQQMLKGIGETDNDRALEYLNVFEEDFSKGQLKELRGRYQQAADEDNAAAIADELQPLTLEEQNAELRKVKNSKQRNLIRAELNKQNLAEKRAEAQRLESYYETDWKLLEENLSYKIPADRPYTPQQREVFERWKVNKLKSKTGKIVTNPQVYSDLKRESYLSPESFNDRNLEMFRPDLSVKDFRELEDEQLSRIAGTPVKGSAIDAMLIDNLRVDKIVGESVSNTAAKRSEKYYTNRQKVDQVLAGMTEQQRNDPKVVEQVVAGVIINDAIAKEQAESTGFTLASLSPLHDLERLAKGLSQDSGKVVGQPEKPSNLGPNFTWNVWRWVSPSGTQFDRYGRQIRDR